MSKKSWIYFEKIGSTGKTLIYKVINTRGYVLGEVKWYAPWRRYCFFASSANIYDESCLDQIGAFLYNLMDEHKNKRNLEQLKKAAVIIDINNRS